MESNLLMRRLRYALSLRNRDVQDIMALGGYKIDDENVRALLQRDEAEDFVVASTEQLNGFLDGLIIHKRGKREVAEGQTPPAPILATNNNMVLRKLRIAFDLKDQDMLDLLKLDGFRLAKAELNALFRKEGHPHFRRCGDQVLRYFLGGLTKQLRPTEPSSPDSQWCPPID